MNRPGELYTCKPMPSIVLLYVKAMRKNEGRLFRHNRHTNLIAAGNSQHRREQTHLEQNRNCKPKPSASLSLVHPVYVAESAGSFYNCSAELLRILSAGISSSVSA